MGNNPRSVAIHHTFCNLTGTTTYYLMHIHIFDNPELLGESAGSQAGARIQYEIERQGYANIILATGASQFEMLKHLVAHPDVEWSKVTMFHLDEYIGMDDTHPASFRKYLRERFVEQLPEGLKAAYFIHGDAPDPHTECRRLNHLIGEHPIDVAMIGIGENGHLAFNDPPADFEVEDPYIVVTLDEACRRQQMGEGWFASLEEVPATAISMSVRHILKSKHLVVSVPDERKAQAVQCATQGTVDPMCPASILQRHPSCSLFLDEASASML